VIIITRAVHIGDFCIVWCIGDAELVLRTHRQCTYQIDASLDCKYHCIASNFKRFGRCAGGETVSMIRKLWQRYY
jgi:hypothetical protein